MAAANTDNFLKVRRKFSTTIGGGGVTDGIVTTIPLTSTTNLPTDTAITITINRVDGSGNVISPDVSETVVGTVVGTNLTNAVRGVEGTAVAHAAGQVVECLWTETNVNRMVSAVLTEHNQDGTHAKVNGNTVPAATDTVALVAASQTLTNKTLTSPVISTISNTGTLTLPTSTDTLVGRNTTDTLTNKRRTRRVVTTTQSATPTINTDNTDVAVITGLAQAITSFTTNLTGTPVDGDLLEIDITDNGTARALTFGASFKATTVALPTTTVINTKLNILFKWSTADSAWLCVAVA